jgi:hypothetical protein
MSVMRPEVRDAEVVSPSAAGALVLALCLGACAPRGPEPIPEAARVIVAEVEQALARRDFASARRHVDFRYRLAESLGELWRHGPEEARADLVVRLAEMFEETSEAQRARFAGKPMMRRVIGRERSHLWIESRVADGTETGAGGFAWQYRLTPKGTSWAITQREYQVDAMRSDSTRFWPMAMRQVSQSFGRAPTLSELAANLPSVTGTLRARRFQVPELPASPSPDGVPTRAPPPR